MSRQDETWTEIGAGSSSVMVGKRAVRRRRADYGSVRASQRDFELLGFVGEQYAVTLPQLARLIGRELETARSLRDRWKRAGWVSSAQLAVAEPSFVWLTRAGAMVGSSPFRVWQPNVGLASHLSAVTDVRILLERDHRAGEWECERAIARRLARANSDHRFRGHLPDGVLHTRGGRVAVEVELTLKSRVRIAEIITALSADYGEVWYFAPTGVARALTEITNTGPWWNIRIHPYDPDAHTTAGEAATAGAGIVNSDPLAAEPSPEPDPSGFTAHDATDVDVRHASPWWPGRPLRR